MDNRLTTNLQKSTALCEVVPDEFLPPISRWFRLGGLALVGVFGGTIVLSALFKYNVTVKAPAVIRPEGDLRIVESAATGKVQQILVRANDQVEQGDELVILDDAELRSRLQQVQAELDQLQQQQTHITQELTALEQQIEAERQAGERAIAAAQAEQDLHQQAYLDAQSTTAANLREAEAALQFAREEFNRFQQLADTGALADLQIAEKAAALETAQARLDRAQGLLNPSPAAVVQAQAEVQHVHAREAATLARLMQTQAALNRQQAELEQQKHRQQQTQHQLQRELQRLVIRAPTAGTLQSLNIRNPGQVVETGEAIAQLAPQTADLMIQAQVSQADAARIQPGQSVHVRLDGCPYTDYGLLEGHIHAISPDTERLESGSDHTPTFYRVEIVPAWQPSDSSSERPSLQSGKRTCFLQMGMLGRADIVTQRETVLIAMLRRLRLLTDL